MDVLSGYFPYVMRRLKGRQSKLLSKFTGTNDPSVMMWITLTVLM